MKAISTALAALAFTAIMSAGPGSEAKAFGGSCCGGGFFVFDIFTGVTDVFFGGRGCYRGAYVYEHRVHRHRHRHHRHHRHH